MSTETQKYAAPAESEPRHSAFEEFSRDERRPAVLLLAGLLIAATFFAIGILVGRWSAGVGGSQPVASPSAATKPTTPAPSNLTPTLQPTPALTPPDTARINQSSSDPERRFAILVATYNTPEDAQPLIKSLEQSGYKDIRTVAPRADDSRAKFSVLVGRYTRDEAREAAERLRTASNPKFKNARIVESGG